VSQSRTHSLFESLTNIVVGSGINFAANMALLPIILHTAAIPFHANILITAVFTVISLVRSYLLRRWFNSWRSHHSVPTVFSPQLKGK
jgi:hypothetical protein